MQTLALEEARRGLAALLDHTQLDGTAVEVQRRGRPAVVAVPPAWYQQAATALTGDPVTVTQGPSTVDELRAELSALLRSVQFEGSHVRLHRHGAPAAVLVPVPWYGQAEAAIGEPGAPAAEGPPGTAD